MHLSKLLIDVGANPDRPRPGRLWLRNLYRVHQRLTMAFPSDPRRSGDREFLKPYRPGDFPPIAEELDVHAARDEQRGFLFRIDTPPEAAERIGSSVLLVQSAKEPDWEYAFGLRDAVDDRGKPVGNAGHLLAAPPQVKPLNLHVESGQTLCFRLRANVTRHISLGPFRGKRVGVGSNRALALEWLARKGQQGGFDPVFQPAAPDGWDSRWLLRSGWSFAGGAGDEQAIKFQWTEFQGLLAVSDPAVFCQTIQRGIGRSKAFGCGLLSVAPVP